MKSLMLLTQWLLNESGNQVGYCTTRDSKTIESRFEKEGLSFLTITLPTFAQGVELALAKGRLDPDDLPSFRFRQGLPVFMQGFLDRIFERGSGVLLAQPCVDSIAAIRQVCRLHSKIELPTKPARTRKALRNYVQVDHEIGNISYGTRESGLLARVAAVLFGPLLGPLEQNLFEGRYSDFLPKHGPGATADRLVGNQKFSISRWPQRLERILPAGEFLLSSYRDSDFLSRVDFVDSGGELPVRVTLVPKTMKTPRVIAMEPAEMQYAQQAILRYLSRGINSDRHLRGLIGLLDQEPNQLLAKVGSITGHLATLDLSEASDRVSMKLVETVFDRFPHFTEVLKATRSSTASVLVDNNQREIIALNKFASMGSALCFPVEAMVFLTIIVSVYLEKGLFTRLGPRELKSLYGSVRVFGDDLIVPADIAVDVSDRLESFGLKVNQHKSFWTGKFRESCGKDWYDGQDVSYIKTRRPFPSHIKNASEVLSLVSLRNQLYLAGYWETCRRLDRMIEKVLPHFPVVLGTSPVVGRISASFEPMAEMIDMNLHLPLVKGYVQTSTLPINSIDGYRALLKVFLSSYAEEENDSNQLSGLFPVDKKEWLERSGRPSSVRLKKRWARLA